MAWVIGDSADFSQGKKIDEPEEDSRQAWEGLLKEFENERKRLVLGINHQADTRKLGSRLKLKRVESRIL